MTTYQVYASLLKEKKLANKDVQDATGITQASLSGWKLGKWELKRDKLEKIASFLNVPVSVFYDDDLSPESRMEKELLFIFRGFNEEGQTAILNYAKFMAFNNEYSKKSLGYTDEAI